MTSRHLFRTTALCAIVLAPAAALAQGTAADYERANGLRVKYEGLATNVPGPANWIEKTNHFWYRRSVKGGNEFIWFDAETQQKRPAFDHARLAAALASATKAPATKYTAIMLPFSTIVFVDNETAIEVTVDAVSWRCGLTEYVCKKAEPGGGRGRGAGPGAFTGIPGPGLSNRRSDDNAPRVSPDGKWEALVNNFNVAVRGVGSRDLTRLSTDGTEGDYYVLSSIVWSPDSKKLAAERVKPGYRREVHYTESSPEDQLQPKHVALIYAKPGDVLDVEQPALFDVEARTQIVVDRSLLPNAYETSRLMWRKDSRALTFEFNQRGHQVYRVLEADASTGAVRSIIEEKADTFFCYSGKKYRYDIADGKEVVWMSERDGWNHLYLYDGVTGTVKNQITKGNWVVRGVVKVDEAKRQVWFSASGMYPGKDPYFVSYYRIDLDGTGLVRLTEADANHSAAFSSDMKYFVDTYSRVDAAPVSELRRVEDGSVVAQVERCDIDDLRKSGWRAPEVFEAKARDGHTDIWGVIIKPTNFDPSKKYPVIENIYAGPQGSFVPKSFSAFNPMMAQAELGFIVVQIDGMGTSNRSKAFHDVAWKNLGDAGFPDRILWHKAVAAKYPWYDITRVGIYGTSAGGQSSLGGLLFHPEFYKAAVTAAGCHDNRMDKIWWNEQWMGWPIGPHYAASSNVDNAYRLQGHVLLVVGEMDNNVDPSSTMQVINQLIKHNKDFDFLYIPGAGHGPGGAYGEHKRFDFFVRHLLGVTPPEWTSTDKKATRSDQDEEMQ